MNYIVGLLLLHVNAEEDVFWLYTRIMRSTLPVPVPLTLTVTRTRTPNPNLNLDLDLDLEL